MNYECGSCGGILNTDVSECPHCGIDLMYDDKKILNDSNGYDHYCENIVDDDIDSNSSITNNNNNNNNNFSLDISTNQYDINLIEEKKSNNWFIYIIDFGIFFILLFTIGWAVAFVLSFAVAAILHFAFSSKDKFNKFSMSLKFEEDELIFESKTSEKSSFDVSICSIISVEDIKLGSLDGKQILILTNEKGFAIQLVNYSAGTFDGLINKLNNILEDNQLKTSNDSYVEFLTKIKNNVPSYQNYYLSDSFSNVLLIDEDMGNPISGSIVHTTVITYLPKVGIKQVKELNKVAKKNLGKRGSNFVFKVLVTDKVDSDAVSYINGWRRRGHIAFYDLTNNSLIAHKDFIKSKFFEDN